MTAEFEAAGTAAFLRCRILAGRSSIFLDRSVKSARRIDS
jgi:hypothetical protein